MDDLESFIARCEANAVPDSQIDLSDAPELTEADFARGHFKYATALEKPQRASRRNQCSRVEQVAVEMA